MKFGEFVFVLDRGELKRGNEPVRITERERDMLRALARAPGETVPRTDLAAPGVEASERAVDVQVNRLRRKIEDDPANPLFIQTVRGVGYRLVAVAMSRRESLIGGRDRPPPRGQAATLPRRAGTAWPWRLKGRMPQGLYARSLLIIVTPMVLLQAVVAFVFMERHWQTVTDRLSASVTQDIAALIEVYRHLSPGQGRRDAAPHRHGAAGPHARFPPRRDAAAGPAPSPSSRCSTRRCRARSGGRSASRSGSTRWAIPRWSRSASSSSPA